MDKYLMLQGLNLHLVACLVVLILILGGGWYVSNRISTAEIDTLTQRNAVLTSAIG